MGIVTSFINSFFEKRKKAYSEQTESIHKWNMYINSILDQDGYIKRESYVDQLDELFQVSNACNQLSKRTVFISDKTIEQFHQLNTNFQMNVNSFESNIEKHNKEYLKDKIQAARKIIGSVEKHELDDQQIMCIMKDAHNHCVIAGAGTGKTTTILGKVKYLLATHKYDPTEILVLSYTHASAAEMKERLSKETNADVTVATFHRFGYFIMTSVEKKKPRIFSKPMGSILKDKMNLLLQDRQYAKNFIWQLLHVEDKSDLDPSFTEIDEYKQSLKENKPQSFLNEEMKSYGEVHIANCLLENGIRYEYESFYKYDTASKEYAQYKPDFYLPDYDIYIEYFGIDRQGNAPAWFEGDNPSQTYQQGIAWKRKIHKQYGTKLIECYAYEDLEGILEDNLQTKLYANNVVLKPVTLEELCELAKRDKNDFLAQFLSSATTIINLARNKKMNSGSLMMITKGNRYAEIMASLVAPLQSTYEEYLKSNQMIDFSDMLIKAEQYISEGKYKNPYKCIIVDEYQDITGGQYRLLQALRTSRDFDLFCVGDDWQSIYRFNGSDISYIMNFENFFGDSEFSRIETTYRFPQSLIDVSSAFIMKNPKQLKKSIHSNIQENEFAVTQIEGYRKEDAIQFMAERLSYLPKNSSVYLLGRYTFDIDLLKTESSLKVKYDLATQTQKVYLKNRPDLDITFYTIHRSKGLQADYIYVLNNFSDRLGFPSKVDDNALINLLLERSDGYPDSEERRLFYVALTRAKRHVYLLKQKNHESIFVQELLQDYTKNQFKNETYICPVCGGRLRIIAGQYGKFLGCENYRSRNCRFKSILRNNSSADLTAKRIIN